MRRVQSRVLLLLLAAATAATLSACGGSTKGKPSSRVSAPDTDRSTSQTASDTTTSSQAATGSSTAVAHGPVPTLGPFHVPATGDPMVWPDVCTFTNIAQLKALNPQITGLKGAPVGTKAQVLGSHGGTTPRNAKCKYNLTTSVDGPDAVSPSYVEISLQGVSPDQADVWKDQFASQKRISAKYPDQFADYPGLAGGTHCFYTGSQLECLKGNYYFDVGGIRAGASGSYTAAQDAWRKAIVVPLASKLGSELS
jgi:LysM repeat protein